MLAAFDLSPLFPWGSVEVHTIGAPRPGNAAFAKVRRRHIDEAVACSAYAQCASGHAMACQPTLAQAQASRLLLLHRL